LLQAIQIQGTKHRTKKHKGGPSKVVAVLQLADVWLPPGMSKWLVSRHNWLCIETINTVVEFLKLECRPYHVVNSIVLDASLVLVIKALLLAHSHLV